MTFIYRILLPLACCFWINALSGQAVSGRVGLALAIGHPVVRVGLLGQCSLNGNWWQTGVAVQVYYSFRQYGPPVGGAGAQVRVGLGAGMGPPRAPGPLESLDFVLGQLPATWKFAYSLSWYFDRVQTSQSTGSFHLRTGPVFFLLENDAFTFFRPGDQFRTGAFQVGFSSADWQVEAKVGLWHGQTRGRGIYRQHAPGFPGRWGFRDLSEGLHGQYSNGVIMLVGALRLPFGQTAQAGAGIDAEQIRNLFQNILAHDLPLVPAAWNKARNPHYPMLDEQGCPWLGQEGQRIRRPRFAWLAGVNQEGVY